MNSVRKGISLSLLTLLFLSFTGTEPLEKKTHSTDSPAYSSLMCSVYERISTLGTGLSEDIFRLAFSGFDKLSAQGKLSKDSILTIIDFSRSSKEKRMFVIDLKNKDLLYHSVVAHGRNTGEEFARRFSNNPNSHQSSLGFYVTGKPYYGSNGYSLQLNGMEKGFNDLALPRAIVIHGAWYANPQVIKNKGYLGRSWGCPALPQELNDKVINTIKDGNCLFIYYPDLKYLNASALLKG